MVVGVREAVEVAAVPLQLGHAPVLLLRAPLPEIQIKGRYVMSRPSVVLGRYSEVYIQ